MKRILIIGAIVAALVGITVAPAFAATEQSAPASVTVNQVMSLTVTDNGAAGINFGSVGDGTNDNPDAAQNITDGAVTLTVGSETNVAVNLQTKGSGNFTGPGTAIPLSNAKWGISNAAASGTAMIATYATVGSVAVGGGTQKVWHWLSVPAHQVAGTYTSTFYYQVVAQ